MSKRILSVVAALAPLSLGAQQGATPGAQPGADASFAIVARQLGRLDTVTAERVHRTPARMEGEFVDRVGGGRMRYAADLAPASLVRRVEIWFYRRASDTAAVQHAVFRFGGDSVTVDAGGTPVHLPVPADALPYINPSPAFLEQILMRARAMGGDGATIPLFITAGAQVVPTRIVWVGADSATIQLAGVTMRCAVARDGHLLGAVIPAQGVSIVRGAPVESAALAAPALSYSAPAGAPYAAENVVVTSPGGVHLAGTLTLPNDRTRKLAAVVTITGSGPEDRDEQSSALPGYRPFREIADTLGRRGIAVLRLDDRGVGGSDRGPANATLAGEANDVRAAVAYLRSRPEIDGDRIALLGHSEGGLVGPMVASSDPRIRALVIMAGPGEPMRALLRIQQEFVVDSMAHLTGDARAKALAQYARNTDSLARTSPAFAAEVDLDPAPYLRGVRQPTLVLQGEKDYQVPVAEAAKVAELVHANGNVDVTTRIFAGVNHLFVPDENAGYNYGKLTSLHVRADVLGTIADWLTSHLY